MQNAGIFERADRVGAILHFPIPTGRLGLERELGDHPRLQLARPQKWRESATPRVCVIGYDFRLLVKKVKLCGIS